MSSGNITCTKTDGEDCLAPGVSTAGAVLNANPRGGIVSLILYALLMVGVAAAINPSFDTENLQRYCAIAFSCKSIYCR